MNTVFSLPVPQTPKASRKTFVEPESPLERFNTSRDPPRLPSLDIWREVCRERSFSSDQSTASSPSSPLETPAPGSDTSSTAAVLSGDLLKESLTLASTPERPPKPRPALRKRFSTYNVSRLYAEGKSGSARRPKEWWNRTLYSTSPDSLCWR